MHRLLLALAGLFTRKPSVRPATMRSNESFAPSRPVRELRGTLQPLTAEDYRPKREPAEPTFSADITALFLISMPREKQLRLARMLRHGCIGPALMAA